MDWDSTLFGVSAGMWTALAAWLAVVVGIVALIYAWRQSRRARQQAAEMMQPNVAMFMEPAANDWHLVELVVRNFGRTPAYDIRFDFANPPTVAKYENVYDDGHVDITPLNLPAEIPYLAPGQEWRIVWDSALDRRELGERIASRFDGAITYHDKPGADGNKRGSRRLRTSTILDWSTLHPVERLELLTTHDLARQEKQKLELLRHLLTYYHYAAGESREDMLRGEIEKMRAASDELRELRDRYRADAAQAPQAPPQPTPQAPQPPQLPQADSYQDSDPDFDEAHTQVIDTSARHRRG
ncbi:hypothetical protein [Mycobacterium sp. IDR2000157661]|uniref:hypothetical protein n=1 Tax=Mycobacterium sp. IDR2000157661 TaxID=2867005 RepID=UPI001EEA3218|nr:hypothetical protein [Mycobacterium sp. IDR2000157661]ULE33978.1 hypothetical protein K3G64_04625 [Mycobacterium sp. IDR2000157661]